MSAATSTVPVVDFSVDVVERYVEMTRGGMAPHAAITALREAYGISPDFGRRLLALS